MPLALEDGSGDKLLLIEALQEQLTEQEQENLHTHLAGPSGVEKWVSSQLDVLDGNPTEFARGYGAALREVRNKYADKEE